MKACQDKAKLSVVKFRVDFSSGGQRFVAALVAAAAAAATTCALHEIAVELAAGLVALHSPPDF